MRKLADIGFFESLNGCSNNAVSDISVFNKRMWVVNVRLNKLFNLLGEDDNWVYNPQKRKEAVEKSDMPPKDYKDTYQSINDQLRNIDRMEATESPQLVRMARANVMRKLGKRGYDRRPARKYTDEQWKKMIQDQIPVVAEAERDSVWKKFADIITYDYEIANRLLQGGQISIKTQTPDNEDFDLDNISRNYNNPNDPNEQEVEYLPDVRSALTFDDLLGLYRRFKADNNSTKTLKQTGRDLGLSEDVLRETLALPDKDDELTGKQIKDFVEKVSTLPNAKRILGINNPIRKIISAGIR